MIGKPAHGMICFHQPIRRSSRWCTGNEKEHNTKVVGSYRILAMIIWLSFIRQGRFTEHGLNRWFR